MENSKHTKVRLTAVIITAMTFLISAVIIILPPQHVNGLSIHNPEAAKPETGNTSKPAPIPTTTPTLPTIPIVGCAKDTTESLQSFLLCLGAK